MSYSLSAEAAEYYEATMVPALFADWAPRAVAAASVGPGRRVLDIACGTGVVARAAADRGAAVVGIDRNEAMLAVARRLRPELRWVSGDAARLPFVDDAFDAAVSQAALMFFPDRVAALREMGRVAAGRVVVQVPGRLAESPGYLALTDVVARHAGPAVRDLFDLYFAVGEPALLTRLFDEAGLRVERFDTWLGATRSASLDTFLGAELLPFVGSVPPDVRARILADCPAALAPFLDAAGAVAAPIEVHLVSLIPPGPGTLLP
ncbi:class I SAM-dependent methyltransferase [Asanoa siamensis]|uniref:Methyltransferase type 11 domain-containing protein n=1 Tax=Asanoa siamensis TaxID=926357 RepID=A0ABQ4D2T3_9ACTN|nr:methyltransferase domain-containing protein [Asanoa siamensis]GIF77588.1 hypothetical protein Asi02nite_71060 [Asanoa siamensis]